jgi:hypothetical protein
MEWAARLFWGIGRRRRHHSDLERRAAVAYSLLDLPVRPYWPLPAQAMCLRVPLLVPLMALALMWPQA